MSYDELSPYKIQMMTTPRQWDANNIRRFDFQAIVVMGLTLSDKIEFVLLNASGCSFSATGDKFKWLYL